MMKDCTIEGQYIDENGSAELTAKELLDQKCEDILGQITNDSMSRSQKIQACWNYVVNNVYYYGWYPGSGLLAGLWPGKLCPPSAP